MDESFSKNKRYSVARNELTGWTLESFLNLVQTTTKTGKPAPSPFCADLCSASMHRHTRNIQPAAGKNASNLTRTCS